MCSKLHRAQLLSNCNGSQEAVLGEKTRESICQTGRDASAALEMLSCSACASLTFNTFSEGVVPRCSSVFWTGSALPLFTAASPNRAASCLAFEAPPDPMPRSQRRWPGSGAVLFTGPIKVSVTEPDVAVESAGQFEE
ncbi:hypothetical protein EYF80_020532 [Liparis tanakae]|uniref:Uncharacterized protein n=1 Tax=Liparis tanakae TaxID=230148 RepID=A0A4Z2HV91_9TELE|nr:hypothetical protein EYF80_020532 [Liparis tanakae]